MAESLERALQVDQLERFMKNQVLRNQCESVVCDKLLVQDVCSSASQKDCLVPYGYGMTLDEVYRVAKQAQFEERLATRSDEATRFDGAIEVVEEPKLPPFKPDWRFWSGVTLAGVGLFLHRSR